MARPRLTVASLLMVLAAALPSSAAHAARTLPLPAGHRSTEAHIAVDPSDPRDVLVVARDEDRTRFVALRRWRSRDGGRSFRMGMLVDKRLDGSAADASDPVALFDHRGAPAPAFLALRYGTSTWQTRIMLGDRIVVSDDHGPPLPSLGEGFGTRRWHDKPWAVVDPADGLALVAWTMRENTEIAPVEHVVVARALPGSPFGEPQVVGTGNGAQPLLGPGSNAVLVWYEAPNLAGTARVLGARSLDRGATWSAPTVIAEEIAVRGDPPFPTVVRSGSGYTACWQQFPARRRGRIACARSTDGSAWTTPELIGPAGAAQPALATTPDGRLWLAFYRYRSASTAVELWVSGTGGRAWRRRSTLMRRRVRPYSWYFLGDYQGLAASGNRVVAAFVMPVRPHGFRQEVVVASVDVRRSP